MNLRYLLLFALLFHTAHKSYAIGLGTIAKTIGYTITAPYWISYQCAKGAVKGTIATHDYLTTPEIVTQLQNKYSSLISTFHRYQSSSKYKLREKLLSNIGYVSDYINKMNYDIYSLDFVDHNSAKELQQTLGSIRNILAYYV